MNKNKAYIQGLLVGSGLIAIVAGVFFMASSSNTPDNSFSNSLVLDEFAPKDAVVETYIPGDHIIGPASAEIMIISYSDLSCLHCEYFHSILQQVVDGFGGRVAWVYRHFPQSGELAERQAEATECAAAQGGNKAFWRYISSMYAVNNSSDIGITDATLNSVAELIDIDTNDFNTCLDSGEFSSIVQQHISSGLMAGVGATPTTFIVSRGKQHKLLGAVTFEEVVTAIQSFNYL